MHGKIFKMKSTSPRVMFLMLATTSAHPNHNRGNALADHGVRQMRKACRPPSPRQFSALSSSLIEEATSTSMSIVSPKNAKVAVLLNAVPRGGSMGFLPGDTQLQIYENISASLFSFVAILYGFACGIAPRGTARVLYGHHKTNNHQALNSMAGQRKKKVKKNMPMAKNEDDDTVKFLMRIISGIATGMGLTAAFSIAAELKGLGIIAPKQSLQHAIGIGLIPRAVLTLSYAFLKDLGSVTDRIHLLGASKNGKGFFALTLVETLLLIASVFSWINIPFLSADDVVLGEIIICCLSGLVLFIFPGIMFKTKSIESKGGMVTPHERLLTRLVAVYLLMSGPLALALHMPSINAFPAVGVATLSYVVFQFLLQFASSDMTCTGEHSAAWSVGMMILALFISAGTLWNYVAL
jgi:hypothetical protein